jgi:hypothetical protein
MGAEVKGKKEGTKVSFPDKKGTHNVMANK